MTTRQFTALLTICADLFKANVAVCFFICLHWWQVLEEFFTYSLILGLLLLSTVEHEHSATHHSLKHREGIFASSHTHVHVKVIRIVDVDCWERLGILMTIT